MVFIASLINIKNNLLSILFEIIQLSIVALVTIVMISSTFLRYQLYKPFKDYFSSDGLYVNYLTTANEDPNHQMFSGFIDDNDLIENLDNIEKIVASHGVIATLGDYPEEIIAAISYDDEIVNNYSPKIEYGKWLNPNSEELEVVVSENQHNWSIGDYININLYNIDEESQIVKAKIVGKIENGAKIPGYYTGEEKEKFDFNDFYYPYYYDVTETPLFMFSYKQLKKYGALQPLQNGLLIKYNSNITEENKIQNIDKISSYGEMMYYDMKSLNKNSKQYLFKQIYDLLPIVFCLAMLILISNISDNALSTRKNLKNYAIYYINGLQWKHCIFINLIQSAIISGISVLLSSVIIFTIQNTSLKNTITIIINPYTIVSVLALIILYILISMIMPAIIIGKNTPKQILTR